MNGELHIVGVDPGLVHTGVVSMLFQPDHQIITVAHAAIDGPDEKATKLWIDSLYGPSPNIWIEGYRQRMKLNTDKRMIQAEQRFQQELRVRGVQVLDNMGVKKIIKQKLMEIVGVWNFSTPTHHQDLRSAARIALLGAVRDKEMNAYLGKIVVDHLNGTPWQVTHA